MRKVAIIQARMGSSRLPGKVLKTLAGRIVLEHVVTRVAAADELDEVVVATSTAPADDAIEAICQDRHWRCIRGSEGDVLSRYAKAARATSAGIVVRATSDCPLFSPAILDAMLKRFDPEKIDYMSTNLPARSFPAGLDCEVMRADKLLLAADEAHDPYDREHVTPFLYRTPGLFRTEGFQCAERMDDIRITLDTADDYENLCALVAAHPELADPATDVLGVVRDYYMNA